MQRGSVKAGSPPNPRGVQKTPSGDIIPRSYIVFIGLCSFTLIFFFLSSFGIGAILSYLISMVLRS